MTLRRTSTTLIVSLLAGAGLAACSSSSSGKGVSSGGTTRAATKATVDMKNIAFVPDAITVKVGQVATWRFVDSGTAHSVTADDGSFDSGVKTSGAYTHTFTSAGTVAYHCVVHPGMKATVTVG